MRSEDVTHVLEIADSLAKAPHWARDAYVNALDPAARPVRIALVADDPSEGLIGFLVTVMVPPQAELETIAVSKQAQRQGIAGLLFAELHAILKKLQITEVMLEVRESNSTAQAFYGSLGFVQAGRRQAYYADPKEDAILLQRLVG